MAQQAIKRVSAIDSLRGLLIVNMGLGHAMALTMGIQSSELWFRSGSAYTELGPFLTRIINHSGACGFFLLMGMSAVLFQKSRRDRGWSNIQIMTYLLGRGVLLIVLQFTIINTAWAIGEGGIAWSDLTLSTFWQLPMRWLYFGVLFALGSSLFVLTFLINLNIRVLGGLTAVILVAPAVYLPQIEDQTALSWMLGPLAVPGGWQGVWVLYTVIPWLGVSMLGAVLGRVFLRDRALLFRVSIVSGCILLAAFLSVVAYRIFWLHTDSVINVLHIVRYPPELLFLAYAIGINLVVLYLLDKVSLGPVATALKLFGETALFFYMLHLFVFAVFADLLNREAQIYQVYLVALAGLVFMLPLCWVYSLARAKIAKVIRANVVNIRQHKHNESLNVSR